MPKEKEKMLRVKLLKEKTKRRMKKERKENLVKKEVEKI